MKWLVAFARFWYEFVVGDSVALAIGAGAVIAFAALMVWIGAGEATQVLLPLAVAVTLAITLHQPK
jgi:hypothetical protein